MTPETVWDGSLSGPRPCSHTVALRIVGRVPGSERYLLVDAELEAGQTPSLDTPARILDARAGVLFEPNYFHSITAHVPTLEPYDAADGELDEQLEAVEVRGPPATTVDEVDQLHDD